MYPELFPGSGFGIIVPDSELLFRIRIQQKKKEHIKQIIGLLILDCVYCRTEV